MARNGEPVRFVVSFADAINWQLYKKSLMEEVVDRAFAAGVLQKDEYAENAKLQVEPTSQDGHDLLVLTGEAWSAS
jgi:hypothetical protein